MRDERHYGHRLYVYSQTIKFKVPHLSSLITGGPRSTVNGPRSTIYGQLPTFSVYSIPQIKSLCFQNIISLRRRGSCVMCRSIRKAIRSRKPILPQKNKKTSAGYS